MMTDNSKSTNIPDYQKIQQSSQALRKHGSSARWNEEVETLTPSPLVRQPHVLPERQDVYTKYSFRNEKDKAHNGIPTTKTLGDGLKASWNASLQYDGSTEKLFASKNRESVFRMHENDKQRFVNTTPKKHSPKSTIFPSSFQKTFSGVPPVSNQSHLGESGARFNQKKSNHSDDAGHSATLSKAHFYREKEELSVGLKTPQEDLRHWQQQHQEQLLHQHLETQALYESPPNHKLQDMLIDPSFAQLGVQDDPPAQWEPVRRAADNIIKEKNMIIEKLKSRILELEEDFNVSETKLHQTVKTSKEDSTMLLEKLQELQQENMSLKDRLSSYHVKSHSEIDDLESKLGAAELDVENLKEMLQFKAQEISDLNSKVTEKSQEAAAWHQQLKDSYNMHHDMKKKLDCLQRYLNDLPTMDESRLQANEILSLREENISSKALIESLDQKLNHMRKTITAKDFRMKDLEEREKQLLSRSKEMGKSQDVHGKELSNAKRELRSLHADKEVLTADLEKSKKLLETTHLKLLQVESKGQSDLSAMEERLTQEVEAIGSLRAEILTKDEMIQQMKQSIKDLGNQSQLLFHEGLIAKECARHLEDTNTEAAIGQSGQLLSLFRHCFSELQALVDVCTKLAQGEEPDISILLGLNGDEELQSSSRHLSGEESFEHYVNQLVEMRKQMSNLKTFICNKYAEDMGNNVHCVTQ